MDVLSPEGLRIDGRRPLELRKINTEIIQNTQANGSAYHEHGNTHVLATVYGPKQPTKRSNIQSQDLAFVNVELSLASFSSGQRKQTQKRDRQLLDISNSIKKIFESVIDLSHYPSSEIHIVLTVLQRDGGMVHTCINAATLALVDAGISMKDYVVACSAGVVDGVAILDLNVIEENANVPTLTIALLPRTNKITFIELESKLHLDDLEKVLDLGGAGCRQILQGMDERIRKVAMDRVAGL